MSFPVYSVSGVVYGVPFPCIRSRIGPRLAGARARISSLGDCLHSLPQFSIIFAMFHVTDDQIVNNLSN